MRRDLKPAAGLELGTGLVSENEKERISANWASEVEYIVQGGLEEGLKRLNIGKREGA